MIGILATRAIARVCAIRAIDVSVEGLEHVPVSGPALIAARHYHHLYDGAALIESIARPVRIFVALDWARSPWVRRAMEWACASARWPVALRADNLGKPGASAFEQREVLRYTRAALTRASGLLRAGEVLVVFPEGYPTVDPNGSRKTEERAFLPFRPGFVSIAAQCVRAGTAVPVIPAGFCYTRKTSGRWSVRLRFGAPIVFGPDTERRAFAADVAARVHELSAAA